MKNNPSWQVDVGKSSKYIIQIIWKIVDIIVNEKQETIVFIHPHKVDINDVENKNPKWCQRCYFLSVVARVKFKTLGLVLIFFQKFFVPGQISDISFLL